MDAENDNKEDNSPHVSMDLNELLKKCDSTYGEESSNVVDAFVAEASSSTDTFDFCQPSTSSSTMNVSNVVSNLPRSEPSEELSQLGVSAYDQTQFETEILDQVDKAMKAHEEEKRKEEVKRELKTVADDLLSAKKRLKHIEKALSMAPKDESVMTSIAKREITSIKKEKENKLKHVRKLEAKQKTLQACLSGNADDLTCSIQDNAEDDEDMDDETKYHLQRVFAAKETEEERLIRLGEMTPFGTSASTSGVTKKVRRIVIPENGMTEFDRFLLSEAEAKAKKKANKTPEKKPETSASKKPAIVIKAEESSEFVSFTDLKAVSRTKVQHKVKLGSKYAKGYVKKSSPKKSLVKNYQSDSDVSDVEMEDNEAEPLEGSDEEYFPDQDLSDDCKNIKSRKIKKPRKASFKLPERAKTESESDSDYEEVAKKKSKKVTDDGDQESFVKRIKEYRKLELLKKHQRLLDNADEGDDYTEFDENFKIPNAVWNKLYKYQQTGVRWLWELHQQNCGGIIGDEMGLGKTIQVIAFLVGLKYSQLQTIGDNFKGLGPVFLVSPATVMHQWVKEFHTWWPEFRVAILHESGSYIGKKDALIRQINKSNGILITSYAGVVLHQEILLGREWHYVILDEGHKIRNPDAQATLAVKQFRTPHRLILSGSPVQNNLKELWSLFDFIFPGKLGTLPVFMQQFSVPIVQGGYANASQVQVQTAYKCATVLRDTIKPYLLRRMKADVKMSINLPSKSEQVLFCQLTSEQANLYKGYINSKEVDSILNARLQIFVGLINLRKICNHPDLFDGGPKIFKDTDMSTLTEEDHYGYYKRAGKMIVVEALLRLWHKQGHRVLLFTQSRQMMEILEIFVKDKGYTYMKMDGSTSIGSRQPLINKFNSDKSIFIFILTTRVGGLGVNLTGADRVIIYDPDWNPSTDTQARERAWRIGQDKQVTIYRLLTAGTIEEKIYHRQIFKQFVTNRVLKDPRQRRFFKSNDLYELFTFQEVGTQGTETSAIFAGTGSEVKVKKKCEQSYDRKPSQAERDSAFRPEKQNSVSFSAEKLEKMKMLAKKLSAELGKKQTDVKNEKNASNSDLKVDSILKNELLKKSSGSKEQNLENAIKRTRDKKKARKRKAAEVDGEEIKFVVKKDVYKPPLDEAEKNTEDDDYVLSKLFKSSSVHTALKHDKIVESSNPDYMIVEGEASRVAKDAIKALKESRRMCARAEEGIPTWTGKHGGAKPRFGQKKKTLPFSQPSGSNEPKAQSSPPSSKFDGSSNSPCKTSSNDLLSAIKKRNRVFGTDTREDSEDSEDDVASPSPNAAKTEYDELLVDIRTFVAFGASVDGQASTKELIDTFKDRLPPHKSAVFKAMLSKICDFHRSSSGEGMWYLKEEFR